MSKLERLITPVGEAKWAHVQKPKAAFIGNGKPKGEPKYQIDVVFEKDDKDWSAWAAEIMKQIRAMPQQFKKQTREQLAKKEKPEPLEKQVPIKSEYDADDKPTGRFFVTFKTGAEYKPGLFDKYGRPFPPDVLVGNGSKVRVNYSPNVYEAFGGGINFYLNAVQVVELVEYKGQSAENYGFDTSEPPPGEGFAGAGPTDEEAEANASEGDGVPF